MVTLAWRPDGLQLAVGCDAGKVVLIDVESGDILSRGCSSFRHDNCITAMHWTQITETMDQHGRYGERKQRCWKRSGGAGDAGASSSCDVVSQSKLRFQRRATKFFSGPCDPTCPDTLLVTADRGGCIALWWMGRVLLTRIDVRDHFTEKEFQLLDRAGQGESEKAGFYVERVSAAPDLTLVLVLLAFCNRTSGQVDGVANDSKSYRMLSLDTTTIRYIREDVALVASTVSRVHTLLDRVVSYGNQMKTEWKNATRIFELKMGLIGSLYEKYACEVSPQEDMLSVLVSGITPPVLAQYFAQDIQEMRALCSGCDSLRTLAEGKLKQGLVELLFVLSEMRGHAKWNPQNYATTLGITISALDNLVQTIEDVLVEVEALVLALHETLHDFALFFQWIMERIRIHTNVHRREGEPPAAGIGGCNASAANGSKSLLNLRHLCDFLQRAADAAKRYRKQQPSQNKYKVETTFGNLVSCHLSARQDSSEDSARQPAARCFDISCQCIQDQWLALQIAMSVTLARTIRRDEGGCFTVGNTNNAVDECHIHFRNPFSERTSDEVVESADESDEGESDEETIDWDFLKFYGRLPNDKADCSTILVGFRLQSGLVLLLCASQRVDCRPLQHETPSLLVWDAAVISFSQESSTNAVVCRGFDFYGDGPSDKQEQLAFVLDHAVGGDQGHQGSCLYLQQYDDVEFLRISATHSFEAILSQSITHNFTLDHTRGRSIASFSTPVQSGQSAISVTATGSRGVLCVILPPARLVILDAEDSEDDEDDDEDNEDVVTD